MDYTYFQTLQDDDQKKIVLYMYSSHNYMDAYPKRNTRKRLVKRIKQYLNL